MGEPLLWWHHHRMAIPPRSRDMRWAVQRYAWGVAVWEGPTRLLPASPVRVVDVVVTDPGAPIELAYEHALDRMPNPGLARRVSRSLPFESSPRTVRAAGTVLLLLLLTAAVTDQAWVLLLAIPSVLGAVLLGDRVPPHHHPAAWRRSGHEAVAVRFSGRIVLADALCRRSADRGLAHAPHVRQVVRVALWECRDGGSRTSSRLNRWLSDLDRADELATGIAMYARSMAGPDGPPTVVDQAMVLAPDLVRDLATGRVDHRREVLEQLQALRDGCRDARAAREALEATVGRAAGHPELRAVPTASDVEREERRDRVGDLLRDLQAEAGILREVDAELRSRDAPHSHGA